MKISSKDTIKHLKILDNDETPQQLNSFIVTQTKEHLNKQKLTRLFVLKNF